MNLLKASPMAYRYTMTENQDLGTLTFFFSEFNLKLFCIAHIGLFGRQFGDDCSGDSRTIAWTCGTQLHGNSTPGKLWGTFHRRGSPSGNVKI